jgi:predicted nuclease of predicted toxin-antitoxin system
MALRFLADENFPLVVTRRLQADGIDVEPVTVLHRGASDAKLLARAAAEGRIVITFDRHFGELAFRYRKDARPGVVFLRITPKSADFVYKVISRLLTSQAPLADHFTVVTEDRVRSIPLKR